MPLANSKSNLISKARVAAISRPAWQQVILYVQGAVSTRSSAADPPAHRTNHRPTTCVKPFIIELGQWGSRRRFFWPWASCTHHVPSQPAGANAEQSMAVHLCATHADQDGGRARQTWTKPLDGCTPGHVFARVQSQDAQAVLRPAQAMAHLAGQAVMEPFRGHDAITSRL